VAISDPAPAHFTAHKNLGNTRTAYKPRCAHAHTHTHLNTRSQEKPRWLTEKPNSFNSTDVSLLFRT